MGIFNRPKKGGFADVIRCDETNYLVWKWHPNGIELGKAKRENALRTNSILRVKNGEVAVFVYKQKNGSLEDYIVGPFEETIKTKNFPVLSSIIGVWYEGDTPFQAEVYFINVAQSVQMRFGIPYFNVVDPRYPDFEVPVAVRGAITFCIDDYKSFIKYHQLITFSIDDLKKKVNDSVCRYIKDAVISAPSENNIPVINIESKIDLISEKAELNIKERIKELYGVKVTGIDINAIDIDKESDAYLELKSITKNITQRQVEANVLNYEEQLRIQREEGQYAQRMATRQQNINAYQTEIQGQVGVAGAEALGKMGQNGVGEINMGSNAGFNPMTMMAGIAVGSTIGKNIAGTMNNAVNPSSNTAPSINSNSSIPPKIPTSTYYLAKDGKPIGPFEVSQLISMIQTGEFKSDSLVWKQGMVEWQRADLVSDFNGIFPPNIPIK